MNDGRDAQPNRGVPNAEASANLLNATSPVPHNMSVTENQTTRSQQPLSLRIDGLSAVTVAHGEGYSTPAYIESSERGSDTSDGRRLDLHSASTLTDSLSSFLSSTSAADQSTQLDSPHKLNERTSTPRMDQEPPDTHMAPQTQPVNGGSIDRWQPSLPPIKAGNTSLSPPPSPKNIHTRSNFDAGLALSQKRNAAGDFKSTLDTPIVHDTGMNGTGRRRSKSTGSALHGNRIAQVTRSLVFS
jgi:hypothetical protein